MAAAHDDGDQRAGLDLSEAETILVEAGTRFEGLVGCRGGIRIDGELEGDIAAQGSVVLGELSRVKGNVEAEEIVVAGNFEGALTARSKIALLATARVDGDLATRELVAEDGCEVRGSCRAGPSVT